MNWQQVLEDKSLRNLPYKIELNAQGQIIMSPVKPRHSAYQGEIIALLGKLKPDGRVLAEPAINTSDNVKVADVGWISIERYKRVHTESVFTVPPEICVEVQSESNSHEEMMFKKGLYFEKSAVEFWLCDDDGNMSFYDKAGKLAASGLVPNFPARIEV
jgi:Uma2 family endonuclease